MHNSPGAARRFLSGEVRAARPAPTPGTGPSAAGGDRCWPGRAPRRGHRGPKALETQEGAGRGATTVETPQGSGVPNAMEVGAGGHRGWGEGGSGRTGTQPLYEDLQPGEGAAGTGLPGVSSRPHWCHLNPSRGCARQSPLPTLPFSRAAPLGAPTHRGPAPGSSALAQTGMATARSPGASGAVVQVPGLCHVLPHLLPVPFASRSRFSHRCSWRRAMCRTPPGRGFLGHPTSDQVKRTAAPAQLCYKCAARHENHPPFPGKTSLLLSGVGSGNSSASRSRPQQSLPGHPQVRRHFPWASPWPLRPHVPIPGSLRLHCCCFEGQISPADTLELVFLPESLKISWIFDTGTQLPTVLPSHRAWGQPSAPGERGRPAPVLLLSAEMMAVPRRNTAVPERNAAPATAEL